MSTNSIVYTLQIPIDMGDKEDITELVLTKPTLERLEKIKSTTSFGRVAEILEACCLDTNKFALKRLQYDDVKELGDTVLPDFLGFE